MRTGGVTFWETGWSLDVSETVISNQQSVIDLLKMAHSYFRDPWADLVFEDRCSLQSEIS